MDENAENNNRRTIDATKCSHGGTMSRSESGYTVIELLIVAVIIGIKATSEITLEIVSSKELMTRAEKKLPTMQIKIQGRRIRAILNGEVARSSSSSVPAIR